MDFDEICDKILNKHYDFWKCHNILLYSAWCRMSWNCLAIRASRHCLFPCAMFVAHYTPNTIHIPCIKDNIIHITPTKYTYSWQTFKLYQLKIHTVPHVSACMSHLQGDSCTKEFWLLMCKTNKSKTLWKIPVISTNICSSCKKFLEFVGIIYRNWYCE